MIEKEGRKLAKEYEKVLSINIEDIVEQEINNVDQKEPSEPSENEEEIYALLNSSVSISSNKTDQENVSTTSGNSSEDHSSVQDIISKESPIDEKNVNENNSDTGLSSLHTSSDEGSYEVGTLVWF